MKFLQAINPQWTPNKSLGFIELGDGIEPYTAALNLVQADNGDQKNRYVSEDFNIYIDTQDKKITRIAVENECFYEGQNIIGMNVVDLAILLNVQSADCKLGDSIVYCNSDIRTPITLDEFGLTAWFSCNALVMAVIKNCSDNMHYDK